MKNTNSFLSKMHRLLLLQEVVPVVIAELLVHYCATHKNLSKISRENKLNIFLIYFFVHC